MTRLIQCIQINHAHPYFLPVLSPEWSLASILRFAVTCSISFELVSVSPYSVTQYLSQSICKSILTLRLRTLVSHLPFSCPWLPPPFRILLFTVIRLLSLPHFSRLVAVKDDSVSVLRFVSLCPSTSLRLTECVEVFEECLECVGLRASVILLSAWHQCVTLSVAHCRSGR